MEAREVLKHVDHTELMQNAKWEDIQRLCDDAVYYNTASICIPPAYVKQAAEYLGDKMAVCTVIGFPHGYNTTATKVFEVKDAIANGAKEVDMVINIGWAKDGKFDAITEEIKALKEAAGDKILVSRSIGEHGLSVLASRFGLESADLKSDCASLEGVVQTLTAHTDQGK